MAKGAKWNGKGKQREEKGRKRETRKGESEREIMIIRTGNNDDEKGRER